MLDDIEALRGKIALFHLLAHYAKFAEIDRIIWQDRVMAMEGVDPPGIAKLHGELIAFGWIEQNTGASPGLRDGVVPACYRATLAGMRAIQQIHNPEVTESDDAPASFAQERVASRKQRQRDKDQKPEVVVAA